MSVLPSWQDGPARRAITDFVERVTREGGADYVPPAERVATFDNDGTLWTEQPMQTQIFFLVDQIENLVSREPLLAEREPFKALLERDAGKLHVLGKQGLLELFLSTHAGMTEAEFDRIATDWFSNNLHPKWNRRFDQCLYAPQIELLEYLAAHEFKTFIVSGGGIDFIRAFAEPAYGIPRERVIGSSTRLRYEWRENQGDVVKVGDLGSFDDREAKPANIVLHIGRRPILAFGNSDGDLAMLRYTLTGNGARLGLLLHHDDAEREVAYDREFRLSPLVEALDKAEEFGITVVSMKMDWRRVFID